jgi:hypothetical protein
MLGGTIGAVTADVLPAEAVALRDWVKAQQVGSLRVVSARASRDEDANGEKAVFLDVTLPPPEDDADTWPLEDVLALHEVIDRKARDLGFGLQLHVRLLPSVDTEVDSEDTDA